MTELQTAELMTATPIRGKKNFTTFVIVAGFIFWGLAVPIGALNFVAFELSRSFEFLRPILLPLTFGWIYLFFNAMLFSVPPIYLILNIGGVLLFCWVFFYGAPTRIQRGFLIYLLCILVSFVVSPYSPAVSPTGTQEMLVPTEPSLFLRGLKNAQARGESEWCQYTLLGWLEDSVVYEQRCFGSRMTRWTYDPNSTKLLKLPDHFALFPDEMYINVIPKAEISHLVDSQGVSAGFQEISLFDLYVREKVLESPDGQWAAFIAKYLYSAEDVAVIKLD